MEDFFFFFFRAARANAAKNCEYTLFLPAGAGAPLRSCATTPLCCVCGCVFFVWGCLLCCCVFCGLFWVCVVWVFWVFWVLVGLGCVVFGVVGVWWGCWFVFGGFGFGWFGCGFGGCGCGSVFCGGLVVGFWGVLVFWVVCVWVFGVGFVGGVFGFVWVFVGFLGFCLGWVVGLVCLGVCLGFLFGLGWFVCVGCGIVGVWVVVCGVFVGVRSDFWVFGFGFWVFGFLVVGALRVCRLYCPLIKSLWLLVVVTTSTRKNKIPRHAASRFSYWCPLLRRRQKF